MSRFTLGNGITPHLDYLVVLISQKPVHTLLIRSKIVRFKEYSVWLQLTKIDAPNNFGIVSLGINHKEINFTSVPMHRDKVGQGDTGDVDLLKNLHTLLVATDPILNMFLVKR